MSTPACGTSTPACGTCLRQPVAPTHGSGSLFIRAGSGRSYCSGKSYCSGPVVLHTHTTNSSLSCSQRAWRLTAWGAPTLCEELLDSMTSSYTTSVSRVCQCLQRQAASHIRGRRTPRRVPRGVGADDDTVIAGHVGEWYFVTATHHQVTRSLCHKHNLTACHARLNRPRPG